MGVSGVKHVEIGTQQQQGTIHAAGPGTLAVQWALGAGLLAAPQNSSTVLLLSSFHFFSVLTKVCGIQPGAMQRSPGKPRSFPHGQNSFAFVDSHIIELA